MAVEQLIKTGLEKAFDKYFYDELVIGKLAKHETKSIIKKGDEIDVKMPAMVTVSKYDGGDLDDPEKVTTSFVKVKVDKGFSVHFGISQIDEDYIKSAKTEVAQADLIREYCTDAVKQAAAQVDEAYGNLYTRAGHYVDNSGNAITLSATTAKDLLAYMEAKFKRGDGKGHTNWIDGQMIAIVPPEYQFYLGKMDELKYVESGHKEIRKGYIGTLCGWDILVSNNVANPSSNVYYPLFGIKGKTLAGGMSKDLSMMHYVPDKNFDTTTTNPYVTSRTTNSGTTTTLQPNTAISSLYNFTNANLDSLLNDYLNPSLNTATNQAKMNLFKRELDDTTRQNLENNIIAPLAQRNMIRSSQATDLYNNLAKQNNRAIADYASNLLASSQNDTGNIINNLMNMALQGYNVISGNQAQSLQTSSGNATRTGSSSSSSYGM